MTISHKGFNANVITFGTEGTIKENAAVIAVAGDRCKAAPNGENFIGICVRQHNSITGVQVEGYVELGYSGNAPTLGYCGLVSAGVSGVKVSEDGEKYRVIKVNTDERKVGFLL